MRPRQNPLAAPSAQPGGGKPSIYTTLFPKMMALELAFARADGMLIAGTDPTGGGGVVPGYSNQRQLELLVEAGFTPVEAIRIGTLNGSRYLGRDARVGSIAAGKQRIWCSWPGIRRRLSLTSATSRPCSVRVSGSTLRR